MPTSQPASQPAKARGSKCSVVEIYVKVLCFVSYSTLVSMNRKNKIKSDFRNKIGFSMPFTPQRQKSDASDSFLQKLNEKKDSGGSNMS